MQPSKNLQEMYRLFYVHAPASKFVLISSYQALALSFLLLPILLLFTILLLFAICFVVLRVLVALLALSLIILVEYL